MSTDIDPDVTLEQVENGRLVDTCKCLKTRGLMSFYPEKRPIGRHGERA